MMDLSGQKIHFMGIGGIGVSALAFMAHRAGAMVSGCDRGRNEMTALLESRGIPVSIGHDAGHVQESDLVVYTSAVPDSHPELQAAAIREMRGKFLARFLDAAVAYGVSGTHGKTTTSWLLAHILLAAGRDPSVFIGGAVPDLPERNHRLGSGPFVAELDESDGSFLMPKLDVAVITNIESDHLSHYGNEEALFDAFSRFAAGVAESGVLVAGADNPASHDIYRKHGGKKISFGLEQGADLRAVAIGSTAGSTRFRAEWRGRDAGEFVTSLPGLHNIQNALAALAVAFEAGVEPDRAAAALATARGVGRRMEELGGFHGARLYSDYAHHPTEVAASLSGLRQRHSGKVLVVFQPHLYTRTRDYADAFGAALSKADILLLADIYAAREEPIPGVDAGLLADAAKRRGASVHGPVPLAEVAEAAARLADGYEAVVMMGAGDIDAVARSMAE